MSTSEHIALLDGATVRQLLEGSERDVMDVVRQAYTLYGQGDFSLPHSTFLRFKHRPSSRIIGLPAYLGGALDVAGMKWVASFPENIQRGLDRAAATLTLNDAATGRPLAFMEASSINAHRTAASAVLAAQLLCRPAAPARYALVGCGYIGFEVSNYLATAFPSLEQVALFDLQPARAAYLAQRLARRHPRLDISCVSEMAQLERSEIVCFATSAGTPWLSDSGVFAPGSLVLHISLRDIAPRLLLECNNIVDDADHVCRENTSLHLTQMATGGREFIHGELPALLNGAALECDPQQPTVFSPFGLGILDIAVGKWLLQRAASRGAGQLIHNFFPTQWGAGG